MNLIHGNGIKEAQSWSDVASLLRVSQDDKRRQVHEAREQGYATAAGTIALRLNKPLQKGQSLWWPHDRLSLNYQGVTFCAPKPNLVVDSGVNIMAQRTFIDVSGAALSPVSNTTNDGVRYGGIDNATTVAAGTHQFDLTGGNRFIALFETGTWLDGSDYTAATGGAAGTMQADLNVTDSDTGIDHEAVGTGNSSQATNASYSLFSMISDYSFQPGVSLSYDLTYRFTIDFNGA